MAGGGGLIAINKNFKPEVAIGIDICFDFVLFCKNENKVQDNNTFFIVGDAENLPFSGACIDVIVNIESALHYPNVYRFYSEVSRILKEKGTFLYADAIPSAELPNRERFLKNLGFTVERDLDITSNV